MRIIGIDWGERRSGIAVSDPLGITAQPLDTLDSSDRVSFVRKVAELSKEKSADEIVLGLPVNMDGSEGISAAVVRELSRELSEASGLKVVLWDERLTTKEAERFLIESVDMSRSARRGVIDKMAATIMLQSYLNCKNI